LTEVELNNYSFHHNIYNNLVINTILNQQNLSFLLIYEVYFNFFSIQSLVKHNLEDALYNHMRSHY